MQERLVLFSGRYSRIMMNKYPYINGHLLVSPRRHTPGLDDLTPAEMLDLMNQMGGTMQQMAGPQGGQMAGQQGQQLQEMQQRLDTLKSQMESHQGHK